mgnify:CR=1 FL=1
MAYALVECKGKVIEIIEGQSYSRESVGDYIVIFDLFIMLLLMFSLWYLEYLVKIDAEKFNNTFLETHEFSVEIWNLPSLHEEYSEEILKAELSELIMNAISDSDQ